MANSDDVNPTGGKPPLLGNIFHLAKATARGVDARDAKASVRRCKSCDAARPDDAGLIECAYCGSRFEGAGLDDVHES